MAERSALQQATDEAATRTPLVPPTPVCGSVERRKQSAALVTDPVLLHDDPQFRTPPSPTPRSLCSFQSGVLSATACDHPQWLTMKDDGTSLATLLRIELRDLIKSIELQEGEMLARPDQKHRAARGGDASTSSFFLFPVRHLSVGDALRTLLCGEDQKMAGQKWSDGGLPLLHCLFKLADDAAMVFRTKNDLAVHGFALTPLLRDFGLDTHLPTDENPAPKAAATRVHPTALNHLRECTKRHLAKAIAAAAAHRTTTPRTFVSAVEPPPPIEVLPFDALTCVPVVDNCIHAGSNVAETLADGVGVHRKLCSASALVGVLRPRVPGPPPLPLR
jgi:hypothetical protein